jgi:alpha-1,3-glucosyltransferase
VFFLAALRSVWAYMKFGVSISGEELREGWMWLLAMVLISPCLVLIGAESARTSRVLCLAFCL